MILYIFQIAFLIISASGATIIISKGDIFKPFRDWVDRMSHKNKKFVHDISIPHGVMITSFAFDGELYPINLYGDNAIENRFINIPVDFIDVRVERDANYTRLYLEMKEKHSMAMTLATLSDVKTFGVYENSERIAWIQFISDMISCPLCCAVWVGMIFYIIYKLGGLNFPPFVCLSVGCITSLVAYLYYKTYMVLGELISYLEKLGQKK